jgi:hypothetical protein
MNSRRLLNFSIEFGTVTMATFPLFRNEVAAAFIQSGLGSMA